MIRRAEITNPNHLYLKTVTGNYTVKDNDEVILVDATGGAVTITLPDAVAQKSLTVYVKKIDSSANAVTIATSLSQTIDGASTQTISVQYDIFKLMADGSNWQSLSIPTSAGSFTSGTVNGTLTVLSASSSAFAVGAAGATNPVLKVDASVASQATGLIIVGNAAGAGLTLLARSSGTNENIILDAKGNGTIGINTQSTTAGLITLGNSTSQAGVTVNGPLTVVNNTSLSLAVGPNGTSNPILKIDCSVASAATGLIVLGQAAGNGIGISARSSGTNENLTFDAKGSGNIQFNTTATGQVIFGRGARKVIIVNGTLTGLGTAQSSTPTAAQLVGGFLSQTGATGAGTITLDTGTNISTQVPGATTGDSFSCMFANLGGGFNLVVTGATGSTVVGNGTIPSGKNAFLTFYCTGANTWNVYVNVSA